MCGTTGQRTWKPADDCGPSASDTWLVDLTFWPTMCLHWSYLKCGSEVTSASMTLQCDNKGWHRQYPRLPWHHLCTMTVTGSDETHSISILGHCYHPPQVTHPPPNPPTGILFECELVSDAGEETKRFGFLYPPISNRPSLPIFTGKLQLNGHQHPARVIHPTTPHFLCHFD